MKKLLLFALVAGLGLNTFAQNKMKETEKFQPQRYDYIDMSTKTNVPTQHKVKDVQVPNPKGTNNIEQVVIGQSGPYGVYSVLVPGQRCLSYLPSINALSFTHRGEENTHPGTDNSTIVGSVSTDGGATFENHLVVAESSGHRHRYPSGQLYNPAGNTDPNAAFLIGAGPSISDGGSTWDQNFFGTIKLDGSNANLDKIAYDFTQDGSQLIRKGMCVTSNGDVYIAGYVGQQNGGNEVQSDLDLVFYKGTKNGDTWTWARNTERVELTAGSDGNLNFSYDAGMAFAQDGSIGYKWIVGQKNVSEPYGGLQPIVFYTEDAGATWTEIEINLENNPIISEQIIPAQQGTGDVWPQFSETEAVVDANGNLQMFARLFGTYSQHPDSVGYYYSAYPGKIFNITINKEQNIKQIMFVDSTVGKNVTKNSAAQYCFGGEAGWDSRLQATVSEDGLVIGAIWGDTPNAETNYEGYNAAPDIKGTARRITGDFEVPVNFTASDIYTGTYKYTFAAPVGKYIENYDGSPRLVTAVSTSISMTEFEGASDDSPTITHSLVNWDGLGGLPLPIKPDAISEVEATNAFTVSQNQPNPFNGTTTITVKSNNVAPVSVEVANIMGQTVFTQNEGTINGSKQITINASNLEAGIYFYTVRVGAESQTKKMMVK